MAKNPKKTTNICIFLFFENNNKKKTVFASPSSGGKDRLFLLFWKIEDQRMALILSIIVCPIAAIKRAVAGNRACGKG